MENLWFPSQVVYIQTKGKQLKIYIPRKRQPVVYIRNAGNLGKTTKNVYTTSQQIPLLAFWENRKTFLGMCARRASYFRLSRRSQPTLSQCMDLGRLRWWLLMRGTNSGWTGEPQRAAGGFPSSTESNHKTICYFVSCFVGGLKCFPVAKKSPAGGQKQ